MMAKIGVNVTTKKVEDDQDEERTPAEPAEFDLRLTKVIEEADEFEYKENVPASEGSENEEPMHSMGIDDEGQDMH
ncbi:hypothetical protein PI124_g13541 [Phytophthora idaei]|nr:hypothetical protein PI124_g13541 [Phytophthora idaei]